MIPKNIRDLLSDKEYMQNLYNEHSTVYIGTMFGISFQTVGRHLEKHGIKRDNFFYRSASEIELYDFISDNCQDKVIHNDRKACGIELDIYIPNLKVAIEYNGLYFHSELFSSRNYHKEKTAIAKDNNIRLIHVWEDDWKYHKERTKKWLLGILNLSPYTKIYGRNTQVKFIEPLQSKELFDNYHIQGFVNSSLCVGLFYKEELMSACLFKKEGSSYNLTRYVTKDSIKIIGGFGKILKNFIKKTKKHIKNIYSFADLTWVNSDNNVYLNNGFVVNKVIPPDYKYIYNSKRCHKFGFRHKSLPKKLKEYNPLLSEHENCTKNNIFRIYDCGKIKYIYEI
jgi:hypothetical protein